MKQEGKIYHLVIRPNKCIKFQLTSRWPYQLCYVEMTWNDPHVMGTAVWVTDMVLL